MSKAPQPSLLQKQTFWEKPGVLSGMASIVAIITGLLCGFIVLFISDSSQAVAGLALILRGGFTNGAKGVGDMLHQAMPIIVTGLSVGFAFKTGLFNIGATGQFTVGAFAALYVGYNWEFLGPIHWVVALLAAMLAGAIWGLIPGLFKAYLNVSEVISSIMMNYIGLYLVNHLVKQTIFDKMQSLAYAAKPSGNVPKLGLDNIFYQRTGDYISPSTAHAGIFIAIAMALLMYVILNKTTFGYELKACGYNRHASRYAGINEKRNIVLSMTIAGALAGLGGGLLYLSGSAGRRYKVVDVLLAEGFNGIPVALLGMSNPIAIIFTGLFVGHITIGGNNLQTLGYVSEVVSIIISVIIYFSAFSLLFKDIILKLIRREKATAATEETEVAVVDTQETVAEETNEGGDDDVH